MYAVGQLQRTSSSGKSPNSYQKANAVERDEGAADTLKRCKEKRRPVEESRVDGQRIPSGFRFGLGGLRRFSYPLRSRRTHVASSRVRWPFQIDGCERGYCQEQSIRTALSRVISGLLSAHITGV